MKLIGHLYTILVMLTAWVMFRAGGLREAMQMIIAMFVPSGGSMAYPVMRFIDAKLIFLIIVGVVACGPLQAVFKKYKAALYNSQKSYVIENVYLLGLLFLCIMSLVSSTYNPFIYFRF